MSLPRASPLYSTSGGDSDITDPLAQDEQDLTRLHDRLRTEQTGNALNNEKVRIDALNRSVATIRQMQHDIFREQFKHFPEQENPTMNQSKSYSEFFGSFESKEAATNKLFGKLRETATRIDDLHIRAAKPKPT